jgi:tetratricopeptide (TPR) repeat protein
MNQPDASRTPDQALDRLLAETHLRVRQERYDEAAAKLAEARQLAPEHPAVLEMDGDLAFARGRFRQAEQLYHQAFQADPGNAKLEEKYATALLKVHQPDYMTHVGPADDSWWYFPVVRTPWVSGLISAILPGLGQWYNGDLLKGAIVFMVWLFGAFSHLYPIVAPLIKAAKDTGTAFAMGDIVQGLFTGRAILGTIILAAVWGYALVDALIIAQRSKEYA